MTHTPPKIAEEGFSFGVFADPHFARKKSDSERSFSVSLKKLEECVPIFQNKGVDFVVCLGDFIDSNDDGASPLNELVQVRDAFTEKGLTLFPVLGNHDIFDLRRETLAEVLGFPSANCYYSFDWKGWHFSVLETNFGPNGMPYTGRAFPWDECYVNPEQLQWLADDLRKAVGPAIVLTHGNLDPRYNGNSLDPHIVRNHEAVRSVIRQAGSVRMVLQGHYHKGCSWTVDGIPYLTLKAIVEDPTASELFIISCRKDSTILTEKIVHHITSEEMTI